MVSEMAALQKWNKRDKSIRDKILANVYCGGCRGSTIIVDYEIVLDRLGVVLRGKCRTCNGNVARFVEDE
jgi:hypothetical protein